DHMRSDEQCGAMLFKAGGALTEKEGVLSGKIFDHIVLAFEHFRSRILFSLAVRGNANDIGPWGCTLGDAPIGKVTSAAELCRNTPRNCGVSENNQAEHDNFAVAIKIVRSPSRTEIEECLIIFHNVVHHKGSHNGDDNENRVCLEERPEGKGPGGIDIKRLVDHGEGQYMSVLMGT